MKKASVFLTLGLSIALLLGPLTSMAKGKEAELAEVNQLIKKEIGKTLNILKNDKLKKEEKRAKIFAIVTPIFNFELIAKLSLGKKYWLEFSPKQRQEFTDAFIEQLQNSYLDKIELFTDEEVEFQPAYHVKSKVYAPTSVISKDKRYEVIYKLYDNSKKMKKGEPKWLIWDVEIEGISIIKSFGLQFSQFLAKNSKEQLIEKMKSRSLETPEDLKIEEKKKNEDSNG